MVENMALQMAAAKSMSMADALRDSAVPSAGAKTLDAEGQRIMKSIAREAEPSAQRLQELLLPLLIRHYADYAFTS